MNEIPYLTEFLTLAVLHGLVLVSPGANFTLVAKNSLTLSRRFALCTALGVALGALAYVSFALFGIGVLLAIAHSRLWFSVLKLLGAGYLVYIGVKSCLSKAPTPRGNDDVTPEDTAVTFAAAVGMGFLSQMSNPKAVIFFISLFTQAISVHTPMFIRTAYGAWMVLATLGWFSFVVLVLSHTSVQTRFRSNLHRISQVFGVILILLGVFLALSMDVR